ncbi:hypothetical protein ElyMa_001538700 [Elysia marginata]|uniref:Uncharacterized protein n=1 Tax=Elysia marginata TaxID=1093978 RepID=A0AAV4J9Y3_9GAST|nr:hypothetical protein ElyMa_001538700 [Elysia marginata]
MKNIKDDDNDDDHDEEDDEDYDDLPISVASDTVETALIKKGLKMRSTIKMESIRDPDGNLTEWLSSRRFVYIDVPKSSIETTIQIRQLKARLYNKELRATMECENAPRRATRQHTVSMKRFATPAETLDIDLQSALGV